MNFFEQQEQARKHTWRLVLLFIAGTIAIVVAVNAALYLVLVMVSPSEQQLQREQERYERRAREAERFDRMARDAGVEINRDAPERLDVIMPYQKTQYYLLASIGTLAVIGIGSLFKTSQLSSGGRSVAELMGGRLVDPASDDPVEKRLINVVEEMAIASGVPTPPVYIIDEGGINAFAAGFQPRDAVIGVTRGCVNKLNRDELQGVIAHEFSHIFNGDMRLNIRLMGVIYGIVVLSVIGYMVLRSMLYSGSASRRSSSNRGGNGGAILAIAAMGVALIIIGALGRLFGRLIQAAVSRQREYLADASAVQFTRNPRGIGGALAKIAGFSLGSKVANAHAVEMSHFFFSDAISSFGSMLASHPPVLKRIKAIDPNLIREIEAIKQTDNGIGELGVSASAAAMGFTGSPGGGVQLRPGRHVMSKRRIDPDEAMKHSGEISYAGVQMAHDAVERLPQELRDGAHDAYSARGVALALLLSHRPDERAKQLAMVEKHDWALAQQTKKFATVLEHDRRLSRLYILLLCRQALSQLSRSQAAAFLNAAIETINADANVTLGEWALYKMLRQWVAPQRRPGVVKYYAIRPLLDDISLLVMALARASGGDVMAEYETGISRLSVRPQSAPQLQSLNQLDEVLDRLDAASMPIKQQIMNACFATVFHDREVEPEEAEVMQAISMMLQVPMATPA